MLKTWDIFDTLIARRCIFPQGVFQIVEQIAKVHGFVQARIAAERNISYARGGNYNLDDIYSELQSLTNAPKNICDNLKRLEYDVEFEQSIPITENIRKVKSGDVLISDMYLSENFIRRLLDKAELKVPVEIVITNNGKSSGRIWRQLAAQNEFVFHIGDNPDSDIKNSRLAGFDSALSILSNPTSVERYLLQKDFNFGAYLREIRLRNPFPEEIKRLYWQLFTLNVGVLLLFVQQIDELQKKYGFEYLGFCGRDTWYMRLLYEKYKRDKGETPAPNDYLYYSRKLVRNSAEELAKYFSSKISDRKALIIDLCGTGIHIEYFRKRAGLTFSNLICICHRGEDAKNDYADAKPPQNLISFLRNPDVLVEQNAYFYFIDCAVEEMPFYPSEAIENLNRATHNSPVRLKTLQIGEKILPDVIFSESNDTENFDVLETCFNEVLKLKLVLPIKSSVMSLEETLRFLLKVLHFCSVQLPLRGQHNLIEQTDRNILKFFESMSVRKK